MRIVNKQEFLKLPENTIFSKYSPCQFGDLCIKAESVGTIDFYYQPISNSIKCNDTGEFVDACTKAEKESIEMDFDCLTRDGMFGDEQLFSVWEEKDIAAFISRLERRPNPVWRAIVMCPNCWDNVLQKDFVAHIERCLGV
jgi:hypothetical protein